MEKEISWKFSRPMEMITMIFYFQSLSRSLGRGGLPEHLHELVRKKGITGAMPSK